MYDIVFVLCNNITYVVVTISMQSLQTDVEEAKREQVVLITDNKVLQQALEQKTASSMVTEDENRRLRENQMYQKEIMRKRHLLKQGQAEIQRGLQEVKEEKVKLKVCTSANKYFRTVLYLYE